MSLNYLCNDIEIFVKTKTSEIIPFSKMKEISAYLPRVLIGSVFVSCYNIQDSLVRIFYL